MSDSPQSPPLSEGALTEAERLILDLEQRATALQNEQDQEATISLLTFFLADEWFAIQLDKVKVVTRWLDVTPVPGTSPHVLGVINFKSTIYPLIDLHGLLSLEPLMPTRASRIVILSQEQNAFAVLVDSMTEVREVRESALLSQVRSSADISTYISSEIMIDERLLGLLNLDAIIKEIAAGDDK